MRRASTPFILLILAGVTTPVLAQPATNPETLIPQPADAIALQNAPAILFAPTSPGPFTNYHWSHAGKPIPGATSAVLRIPSAQPADAGDYTVAFTRHISTLAFGDGFTLGPAKLTVLPPAANPAPALPNIPDKVFSILDYGAKADATTDNAPAIEKTIAAAVAAGGGIVQIPAAPQPYLTGPLTMASKINLEIDAGATLRMLPFAAANGVPAFPLMGNTYPNLLFANNLHDIALTGGGVIDGDGPAWWAAFAANKNMPHRPFMVRWNNSTNVLLSGVTLKDSPMFHAALSNITNLTVFNLTVKSPPTGPNTDGIDPSGSHQLIQSCNISVGDDNIAVKAGNAFCSDLTIADCIFGTGHGLSIGGQTNRGLDGMTVKHCTFDSTTSGLRMKADPTQGGPVKNVTFTDLTMTNVRYPIVFYSYYKDIGNPGVTGNNQITPKKAAEWNTTPPESLKTNTMPSWKNISIKNLTATNTKGFGIIWGLPTPDGLIDNVILDNVKITGPGNSAAPGLELYNATNIQFLNGTDVGKLLIFNTLAITTQPHSQSAARGATAIFTAAVSPATATFQWLFNDKPLTDSANIFGSTTNTLKLTNLTPAQAGEYRLKATTTLDLPKTSTSAAATLKISP